MSKAGREEQIKSREKTGAGNYMAEMKISPIWSIRARILMMSMAAIVIVSMLQIFIFSSMSRKQFKDMVV